MDLLNIIRKTISDYINESSNIDKILNNKYIDDLKQEILEFNTDEELLRSGGISIETLDRLAHGFSEDDIKRLHPKDLKIRWIDDLENVEYEIKQSGLTPKEWAKNIDLKEPIEVDYWEDTKDGYEKGFYIQDGHHRYMAAKILNKILNVDLKIKINPFKELAPNMRYDDFHRYVFNLLKNR